MTGHKSTCRHGVLLLACRQCGTVSGRHVVCGWRTTACLVLLAGLAALPGCGTASLTDEPAERSPQRAEFELLFDHWKPFLSELCQLRKEYAAAEPDTRSKLEKRYDQMLEKGMGLEAQLVDAAVVACVKEPEENEDLAGFLMGIVDIEYARENYEKSLRLAQILIDNRLGGYPMYFYAAIAAFAVGEFEISEKHLQVLEKNHIRLAGRNNPIQAIVDECRTNLAYYKKAWEKEQALREQEAAAGDLPRVVLRTNRGEIELELFENEAPNTVANFISLVEKGFYDGLTFYRVEPMYGAVAGCPEGNGTGGPGYRIRCECYQPNHRLHFRGSLSMFCERRDTGGSQFFIAFRPARELDGKRTVFGRVVRGLEVLARLQRRNPTPLNQLGLPKADKILEAKVVRKRNHPYDPKIIPDAKPDAFTEQLHKELMPF